MTRIAANHPLIDRRSHQQERGQHHDFREGDAMTNQAKATDTQVGGDHYRDMTIQPVEYIHRNGIGFCEGAAIKYLSRWRAKGGIQDLEKARHFIDLLIEMETQQNEVPR